METKTYVILGMGAVAAGILYYKRDALMDDDDPKFREGFAAGFLTPGPFTILALTGFAVHTL